jgi:hypothetical protein
MIKFLIGLMFEVSCICFFIWTSYFLAHLIVGAT